MVLWIKGLEELCIRAANNFFFFFSADSSDIPSKHCSSWTSRMQIEMQPSRAPLRRHQYLVSSESHSPWERAKPLLCWSIWKTGSVSMPLALSPSRCERSGSQRICAWRCTCLCFIMITSSQLKRCTCWPQVRSRGLCYQCFILLLTVTILDFSQHI